VFLHSCVLLVNHTYIYIVVDVWVLCDVRGRRRRFPPKIRLLTEEEYVAQGIEETRKALEELRVYCHSPNCDSWKTVSRLSSPVQ